MASGVVSNILQAIGHTPLVRLNKVTGGLPVTFYAKVEALNPGGSGKDRIALAMVEHAEREGLLKPGGTIIEATAGNTGAGLAMVAAQKGYRCIFVMPDKMSEDKRTLLKAYGAEVVVTPTNVAPDSPESYNGVADRLARELPNAYRPGQFSNPFNPQAHYLTTGPEIWEALEGKLDVFVAGMGTCGTISGVGKYLKEKNPAIQIIGADPEGSILSGDAPKSYKVEGIGEDFIPSTFNRQVVDDMVRVSDAESFHMARRLAREEGLLVGGSCGTAMTGALKYAARLKPGSTVVVLLPDTGRNYLTKIYNDDWMQAHGFMPAGQSAVAQPSTVAQVLEQAHGAAFAAGKTTPFEVLTPEQSLQEAFTVMQRSAQAQLPVIQCQQLVGSFNELGLMQALSQTQAGHLTVAHVMGQPLPVIAPQTPVQEAKRLFMAGHSALWVEGFAPALGYGGALLSRSMLVNQLLNH